MPALVLFGRRSRIGSDDLYCPALFLILYQIPWCLLAVLYVARWRRCAPMSFTTEGIPFWFMLAAIPTYLFMACVYLMVAHVSTKGTIVEHERRMVMPRLLRVHAMWSSMMLAFGATGLSLWYNMELCSPDAEFVLVISAAMVAEVSFTFTLGLCILGGAPSHREGSSHSEGTSSYSDTEREIPNSDVYVPHRRRRRWERRCHSLCACLRCATCNLFGGAGTRHDSMSVVAKVVSRLFYGSPDLVLSDIVAGFVLLAAVQAHEEAQEMLCEVADTSVVSSDADTDVMMLAGDSTGERAPHVRAMEGVATLKELRQKLQGDASYDGSPESSRVSCGNEDVVATSTSATGSPAALADSYGTTGVTIASPVLPPTLNLLSGRSHGSVDSEDSLPEPAHLLHHDYPSHATTSGTSTRALSACIEELAHFSRFAVGIYGWMLYIWSHPWSGTFRLAFACMKRSRSYIHGDNWFHFGQAALQLESGVRSEDIVYASFKNTVYRPAFCVVLDHERREVVVAIRGTLSFEDCLTDAIAYGHPLDELADRIGCDGRGEYAHQGFLHAAEGIYMELNRLGVLEMLLDPDSQASVAEEEVNVCDSRGQYRDYGLVITGHSLGAATAVLVSIMLRPRYGNLRCLAFSPPGCTLSPGLAARCAAFVTSVVVGYDIVARASMTSAEELRDQVIDLIGRSKVGKAAILRQVTAWKKPHELLHDEQLLRTIEEGAPSTGGSDDGPHRVVHIGPSPGGFVMQLANYRTMLQRIQTAEPIHPLTIPGRLIHLKRRERVRHLGCWVCCRPGSGGVCCTERTDYNYSWASAEQFKHILIARTMLDDHFPDKVHHVLQDCAQRLRAKDKKHQCS